MMAAQPGRREVCKWRKARSPHPVLLPLGEGTVLRARRILAPLPRGRGVRGQVPGTIAPSSRAQGGIMHQPEHFFPSYTRLEHFADACVHAAGLVFQHRGDGFPARGGAAHPARGRYRRPDRLLHRAHRHVRRIRRLQSRLARQSQGSAPAPRSFRHLRHDRRQLYALRNRGGRQRGRVPARGGVGHRRGRREPSSCVFRGASTGWRSCFISPRAGLCWWRSGR